MPALAGLTLACAAALAAQAPAPPATPAEQRIAQARRALPANASRAQVHDELALALARRARETGDPSWYGRAEEAIQESLRLAPDGFEALKIRAWVLLGKHEFGPALELAQQLNRRAPDDAFVYGLLTDAYTNLGRYAEAEESAQWMLDIRPGQVPALTRAAYLRELFGDLEGAIELMEQAYEGTPSDEVEDRAWILTQLGHLRAAQGRLDLADALLQEALAAFPGYHYALGALARVRAQQGRPAEALELQRRHYSAAPHPENLYLVGEALERAGRAEEVRRTWAEFEEKARAESAGPDNSNHELVFHYVDRAGRPADALRIAESEAKRRQDLRTLEAFAWALSAQGRHQEARAAIEKALAPGLRDAGLLYHAGAIAARAGDAVVARERLAAALAAAPVPEIAGPARALLARLPAARAGS